MKMPLPPSRPSDPPRRRVLLVDDSAEVLYDLRQLLELCAEIEIVAEAGDGQEAVRLAANLAPDVVVMDLEMPVMNGYEAARLIKSGRPATRIVILSVHAGAKEQEDACMAGADVFVVKGARYEVMLNAILARDCSTD